MFTDRVFWSGEDLWQMHRFHNPLIFLCVDVLNSRIEAEKMSLDKDLVIEYGGKWVILRLIGANENGQKKRLKN